MIGSMAPYVPSLEIRDHADFFWSQVANGVEPTDCKRWVGRLHSNGRGVLSVHGREILAHRFSYLLNVGPIPEFTNVTRTCRTSSTALCVLPAHLDIDIPAGRPPFKLTPAAIDDIAFHVREKTIPAARLAAEYGVSARWIYIVAARFNLERARRRPQ